MQAFSEEEKLTQADVVSLLPWGVPWVQYPEWMGSLGWTFYVRLNVLEGHMERGSIVGSEHDSIRQKVSLAPIRLVLDGKLMPDEVVVDTQSLVWYPLRRLAEALHWTLLGPSGNCLRKSDGKATVITDKGRRDLAVQILGDRGRGFVRLKDLVKDMGWTPTWWQSNWQFVISTN